MTKYGYARVSSTDQDLTIQREALKAAGCEMIREEKKSGASRSGRDELTILLEFLRSGDVLVVTKLDRLARNTIDTLSIITDLGKRGVRFTSLAEPWANTDTPSSEFVLTLMAGVAQFERARIRERQIEGIARAKAQGKYKGRPPHKPEIVARVRELSADKRRPTDVAKMVGVSRASVYRILRGG